MNGEMDTQLYAQTLKDALVSKVKQISNLQELEELRINFLGKNGLITQELQKISSLPSTQRKDFGNAINVLRNFASEAINMERMRLEEQLLEKKLQNEKIDVSLPERGRPYGKQHIISSVIEELEKLFVHMGYTRVYGPEIEDDWHNFTALNMPAHHPARDAHDTFYISSCQGDDGSIEEPRSKFVLRTHTSSVQIRYMNANKPPFYIISIGKVYRSDYDATHTPMFHQLECLCIDKDITFAHMKGTLQTFLGTFFNNFDVPLRLRPSYFPFTEPSAEVDIQCDRNCGNVKIGEGNGWLEILGCGMVHRNVLANVGVSIQDYQGFAFGVGVERLAMLKYNISDLRSFFENDIRWLNYYGQI
ncbi:Phenylalanine--tRNA ligase alpha subunit [Alphaproteobacteria bacterium]